jgi:hypothetical protein
MTKRQGEYFELRKETQHENGENRVMRGVVICTSWPNIVSNKLREVEVSRTACMEEMRNA